MPELPVLLTYIAVLTGFVFFPGPSILLTLTRSSTSGIRIGVAPSLGIGLGDLFHSSIRASVRLRCSSRSSDCSSCSWATLVTAVAAGHVGRFRRQNPGVQRWQSKVVGSIYCALGIRLAFQDR